MPSSEQNHKPLPEIKLSLIHVSSKDDVASRRPDFEEVYLITFAGQELNVPWPRGMKPSEALLAWKDMSSQEGADSRGEVRTEREEP